MMDEKYELLGSSDTPEFDLDSVNLDGGDYLLVAQAEDENGEVSEHSEPALYSREPNRYVIKRSTLEAIADSVRAKTGKTEPIYTKDIPAEIESINPYIEPNLQEKDATVNGPVTPDSGFDGLSKVNVNVLPNLQAKDTTVNGPVTPDSGFDGLSKVNVNVQPKLQEKDVSENGEVTPDPGFDGLSKVNVHIPIPELPGITIVPGTTYTFVRYPDVDINQDRGYILTIYAKFTTPHTGERWTSIQIGQNDANGNGVIEYHLLELNEDGSEITSNVTKRVYTVDDGWLDGYNVITVNEYDPLVHDSNCTSWLTENISSHRLQEKTATENGEVIPDHGYDGLSKVTVSVGVDEYDGSITTETIEPKYFTHQFDTIPDISTTRVLPIRFTSDTTHQWTHMYIVKDTCIQYAIIAEGASEPHTAIDAYHKTDGWLSEDRRRICADFSDLRSLPYADRGWLEVNAPARSQWPSIQYDGETHEPPEDTNAKITIPCKGKVMKSDIIIYNSQWT